MYVLPKIRSLKNSASKFETNKEIYGLTAKHSYVQWASWQNFLFLPEESFKIINKINHNNRINAYITNYRRTSFDR